MAEAVCNDELLRRCILGDEKAWGLFVDKFAAIVRWAIKDKIIKACLSVDNRDIDDIFQQTFLRIWRNNRLKNLRNTESLTAWLVVIAQNETLNFAKKSPRFNYSEDGEINEDLAVVSSNPKTETITNQLYEAVEELLEALPIRDRRIMTLELFYDLKHREIARIMEMPINTVSTIISRTKQQIREKLIKRGYDA